MQLRSGLGLEVNEGTPYDFDMPLTLQQLAEEAMQLPAASRALLADQLVESLDFAEPDEIQRLWATEAVRRLDEIRSGRVKPVPGEQVLEEVRRIVGR
jgi:putative addiction module component (TIGR02574 family)